MTSIALKSFAKINLSLDVTGRRPDGMHTVDMVMQQISLCDEVSVAVENTPSSGDPASIRISSDDPALPGGSGNLAYRAAELMAGKFGLKGSAFDIRITKRIPMAAGLAGGSADAAAVLHAINALCGLDLGLGELAGIGAELGSDVPFCVNGQAAANENLPAKVREDPEACTCARATGTGTETSPAAPLRSALVLAKPDIGISTAEVFAGIDSRDIPKRPDNDALCAALGSGSDPYGQMINVLENYTLYAKPEVAGLKALMEDCLGSAKKIMMSGSGPTVFALYGDGEDAEESASSAAEHLRSVGYEAHAAKTLI